MIISWVWGGGRGHDVASWATIMLALMLMGRAFNSSFEEESLLASSLVFKILTDVFFFFFKLLQEVVLDNLIEAGLSMKVTLGHAPSVGDKISDTPKGEMKFINFFHGE